MWQAYEIITTPFDRRSSSASVSRRSWWWTRKAPSTWRAIRSAFLATQPLASLGPLSAQIGGDHHAAERRTVGAGGPRSETVDHGGARALQRQHAARHGDPRVFARYLSAARSWKRFARSRLRPRSRLRFWCRWAGSGASRSPARCCACPRRFDRSRRSPAAPVAFKAPGGQGRNRRARRYVQQHGRRPAGKGGAQGGGPGVGASRRDRPAYCGHRARDQQPARRHAERDQHLQAPAWRRCPPLSTARCRCWSAGSRRFAKRSARCWSRRGWRAAR